MGRINNDDIVLDNPNQTLIDCATKNSKGDQIVCRVKCEICAKDSVLFGDGVFTVYRPVLRKRRSVSCGCSGHYKWSTEQYVERVRRKCSILGYSLVRYDTELNSKSLVELLCHKHNSSWTPMIDTFLGVGSFCKECTKEKLRLKFYKGEEEATKEVLKELSNTPQYTFVGWLDRYENIRSKFELHCSVVDDTGKEHGSTVIPFIKFKSRGQRCKKCSTGGFKLAKPASVYVFKIDGDYRFCGYGVTNNFKERLRGHRHKLKLVSSKIEEMHVVSVSGEMAWVIEKALMGSFSIEPQPVSGFIKEATNYDSYEAVCAFVDSLLSEGS